MLSPGITAAFRVDWISSREAGAFQREEERERQEGADAITAVIVAHGAPLAFVAAHRRACASLRPLAGLCG
jgi:hypothetical protein